jgi:hypothetical protein
MKVKAKVIAREFGTVSRSFRKHDTTKLQNMAKILYMSYKL